MVSQQPQEMKYCKKLKLKSKHLPLLRRKHFIIIADSLRKSKASKDKIETMAIVLKRTNSLFDKKRFIEYTKTGKVKPKRKK